MRLLRLGPTGHETPAAQLPDGTTLDLTPLTPDITPTFLTQYHQHKHHITPQNLPTINPTGQRIGPPITTPGAIYGIGLNYADHAKETNLDLPPDPLVFMIAPSSITGPNDPITLPPGATTGDWEVELGIIIGHTAHLLPNPETAHQTIFGYVAANDISERTWQMHRGGQWSKGKSFPTSHPIGPHLVTADELPPNPQLDLTLKINGQTRQHDNTRNMIFPIDHIIHHLSQFTRLQPGDLILTGTPQGVGLGHTPPIYLNHGDTIDLHVEHIGQHHNTVNIPPALQ